MAYYRSKRFVAGHDFSSFCDARFARRRSRYIRFRRAGENPLKFTFFLALPALALTACGSSEQAAPEAANSPTGQTAAAVEFTPGDNVIAVNVAGKPFTEFHFEEKWDKPFLFPLRSASGTVVSRGWPVDPRPGEEQDHAWHRGAWWGHGDVNGQDFWRELGREKTSLLVPQSPPVASGDTLTVTLGMQTPDKKLLGTVVEEFKFSGGETERAVDARIEIRADQDVALTFGDTDDGGFGFRLADQFREDHGALLVNSNGEQGTDHIWGKNAKWIDYSAVMEGTKIGVAVFDHPSNFRHPTGWHARGYSLCSANPFAERSFTRDKSKDGSHTIPAGESLTFRYRLLIHEGDADAHQIESMYQEYAKP
jgi:hypothetical protein